MLDMLLSNLLYSQWASVLASLDPVAASAAFNFSTAVLPPTSDQPNHIIPPIFRDYAHYMPRTHHRMAALLVQRERVVRTRDLHIHDTPSVGNS
jgi:hypothetical protein